MPSKIVLYLIHGCSGELKKAILIDNNHNRNNCGIAFRLTLQMSLGEFEADANQNVVSTFLFDFYAHHNMPILHCLGAIHFSSRRTDRLTQWLQQQSPKNLVNKALTSPEYGVTQKQCNP